MRPFLVDPSSRATEWLKTHLKEQRLEVINQQVLTHNSLSRPTLQRTFQCKRDLTLSFLAKVNNQLVFLVHLYTCPFRLIANILQCLLFCVVKEPLTCKSWLCDTKKCVTDIYKISSIFKPLMFHYDFGMSYEESLLLFF